MLTRRISSLSALLCLSACASSAPAPDTAAHADAAPEVVEAPAPEPVEPPFCQEGARDMKRQAYRWCVKGDVLHGAFVAREGNTVLLEGAFVEGKMHGPWRGSFPDGKPRWRATFAQGQEQGQVEGFYPSGAPRYALPFEQGRLSGEGVFFYENGQPSSKINYTQGKPVGEWSFWHDNGQLAHQFSWNATGKEGVHKHWKPDGKPTSSPVGRMSNKDVEPALDALGEEVVQCYRHARVIDPSEGKLVAQLAIDYTGDVTRISIFEEAFSNNFMSKCARRMVEGLRFPHNPYGALSIIRSWELGVQ